MEEQSIKFSRVFARANAWTFQIPPIMELIKRYAGNGDMWIDPFCGKSTFAMFRNDMNPEMPCDFHMEAEAFCKQYSPYLIGKLNGILFDPPYSYRQVSEHYKAVGMKASALDTSSNFTLRVKEAAAPLIKSGGHAITLGWHTNGFGKKLGFEIIEVMIVAHGLTHNDTLVTVERKT